MASWGVGQFLSIIILSAVLFTACSDKTEIPEDIMSRQEMTSLLIQVHLLESKIAKLKVTNDSSEKLFAHFERRLLDERGVDSADYHRSLDYFVTHPTAFKPIYEAVVDSLLQMEAIEKLREEEEEKAEEEERMARKAQQDSIRNLPDSLRNLKDDKKMLKPDTGAIRPLKRIDRNRN